MNIFQHLEKIDECIKEQGDKDLFFSGVISDLGIGLDSDLHRQQSTGSPENNSFYYEGNKSL